jgi:hypothetical protein
MTQHYYDVTWVARYEVKAYSKEEALEISKDILKNDTDLWLLDSVCDTGE